MTTKQQQAHLRGKLGQESAQEVERYFRRFGTDADWEAITQIAQEPVVKLLEDALDLMTDKYLGCMDCEDNVIYRRIREFVEELRDAASAVSQESS